MDKAEADRHDKMLELAELLAFVLVLALPNDKPGRALDSKKTEVLGELPMTGVIVRSSANVQAGATTRLSTMFHGLWLLAFVLVLALPNDKPGRALDSKKTEVLGELPWRRDVASNFYGRWP